MPEPGLPIRRRVARTTFTIGASFSILMALLLLANWWQVRALDPLASPALGALRARLRDNPSDQALREEIRTLDLLARRAFFASQWQERAGGLALLGAIAVTLLAGRAMRHASPPGPPAAGCDPDQWWIESVRTRRFLAVAGGALLVASGAAALMVRSPLDGAETSPPASTAASALSPADWPSFRGPGGSGLARAGEAPLAWDGTSGRGIAWKVAVPLPGRSSPIVIGKRIFLSGADETTQEVYCVARDSGALEWRRSVGRQTDPAQRPRTHPDTGLAAPTMTSDGTRVFAIFPTGDLAAFDLTGTPLWSESLGVPDNHYGHASSLITYANLLIVQWDQNANARLLAYDVAGGRPVWRTPRDVISWASPLIADTGARSELIVTNSRAVAGYDPGTGAELWRSDCLGGEMGPSAAFADGLVFVANDRAKAAAVRPGGQVVWEYRNELPDTASPVAAGGLVFLATSYGPLVCLDAQSGAELWKQELPDGFYASPIVVGERLYALDLKGVMHIVKVARTFERLGQAALGEPCMATPAFVGGRIYVRSERSLCAISGE